MNFNSSNVEGRKLFSPWRFVVGSICRDPRLALSAYPGDEALPKWQTSGSLTRRQYHIWAFIYLCAYYTLLEAPCPVLFLDASKHCVSLHFTQRVTTTISAWTSGGPSSRRNVGVYPMDGWYVHTIPKTKRRKNPVLPTQNIRTFERKDNKHQVKSRSTPHARDFPLLRYRSRKNVKVKTKRPHSHDPDTAPYDNK